MACDALLGKGITNFPCDLPKGHEGPHASPSVMKSVTDRQNWQIAKDKQAAQPGPGLPWENVDGFQPGVQRPHPRQLVKCAFCPDNVPFEEMLQHVSSHVGMPNPALMPPMSSAFPEAPPGTPQPAANGVFGGGSANALADHIARHPRPQQSHAPVFVLPPGMSPVAPSPYGGPGWGPQAPSGVAEAVANMAGVIDPAAYRQGPSSDQVVQEYIDYDSSQEEEVHLMTEVERLLNRYSRENASNTPDFILAEYLMSCLRAFEGAVNARDNWYQISQPLEGSSPS